MIQEIVNDSKKLQERMQSALAQGVQYIPTPTKQTFFHSAGAVKKDASLLLTRFKQI